ncbi:diguanylate cyclase domain-containing protein [Motiliproteus sp.]|uniref:diguanylate cyclase domain-containing protein n=1 Tax=Motiliproteus sp. TaxID=1898955 RepID=UPI003BACFF58
MYLSGLLLLGGQAWGQSLLRVGLDPGDPALMARAGGELTALYIEVLEAVAAQQQWQLQFHTAPRPQLLQQLDRGELDLLAGLARTEELSNRYDFSEQALYTHWAQLLTIGYPVRSIRDLNGSRIAVAGSDPLAAAFEQQLSQLGIQAQWLDAENYDQVMDWLNGAEIDGVLVPRTSLNLAVSHYRLQLAPVICCVHEVGFMARRSEQRAVLEALDHYLAVQKSQPGSDYQRGLQRLLEADNEGDRSGPPLLGLAELLLLGLLLAIVGLLFRYKVRRRTVRLKREYEALQQRVQLRTSELSSSHASLEQEVMHHRATQQQLRHMARFDPLTGLPNRRYFSELMEQELKRVHRTGRTLVVMLLDLDGFKRINDRHGHETGDQVLVELAARLSRTLREVDSLARLGGDEFVVMLSEIGGVQDAPLVAQKLIDVASQPLPQLAEGLGVHIGISYFPDHGYEVEQLLSKADRAICHAKRKGKSGYVDFEDL